MSDDGSCDPGCGCHDDGMPRENDYSRRSFLKSIAAGSGIGLTGVSANPTVGAGGNRSPESTAASRYKGKRTFNSSYSGPYLEKVAVPIGGIGAGMFCLEGTGAISQVSFRHILDFFKEPMIFAAVSVNGYENGAKVLQGPVRHSKYYGGAFTARGSKGKHYGLPRYSDVACTHTFPFSMVDLQDPDVPVKVKVTGWSPFIPGNTDDSCLPVGALEYTLINTGSRQVDAVFSFHSENLMALFPKRPRGHTIRSIENGFVLCQFGNPEQPHNEGYLAVTADSPDSKPIVDHCWFKGPHYDSVTVLWQSIAEGRSISNPPQTGACPGASLYCPLKLKPGAQKTVRIRLAWYVPKSDLSYGKEDRQPDADGNFYEPWYATRFKDIESVNSYWSANYDKLRKQTESFSNCLYDTSLSAEVMEAVTANLNILRTPTVLREKSGRLWGFEGCNDLGGCCYGSCTHVWNYAQAISHLFPDLERSLRQTEFNESQNAAGRQAFRSNLPLSEASSDPNDYIAGRYAATDGQLGGIMKVYREWRISGDTDWLKSIWPQVRQSLDFCIRTWDPRRTGILEEPQHNTYDIQFWGPNSMCSSFYLGALTAASAIGAVLGDDVREYEQLKEKGRRLFETELYNGEYFIQKVRTKGLIEKFEPLDEAAAGKGYLDIVRSINQSGPKYQYGNGCLSDGLTGIWLAKACGLGDLLDPAKIRSHLKAVYKYNLKKDLSDHVNPQRPSYALGDEGGLLLCTWPKGDPIPIPFIYSNEVWTGIEYMAASHMMMMGLVEEGLDIVRTCRNRYNGTIRNPFDEYECGHYYVRAMSSYALLQGLTGIRYDAVDRTLYIDAHLGDSFQSFLSTASGFGTVGLRNGKPFLHMQSGQLDVRKAIVAGRELSLVMD